MARIQILELPTEHHGDDMTTPFLLILDQVEDAEAISTSMQGAKELSGARGILAFEETIEIPANEVTLTEATEGNVVRLRVEPDLTGFDDAIEQAMTSARQKINLRLGGNSLDAGIAHQQEPTGRPAHPDGTPYNYSEIVAGGWTHCDGCRTWSQSTPDQLHDCPAAYIRGPVAGA